MTPNTDNLADRLLDILELEPVDENLFLGDNEARREGHPEAGRLFGGQVLSQALRAAYHTVDDRRVHSLHGYFLRAGDASKRVLYEVDRIRDGGSFTTRRVVAVQDGRAIFNMSASFQVVEPGFDHAEPMPNVPRPHELPDDIEVARQLARDDARLSPMAGRARPFEMRSVFTFGTPGWAEARSWNPVWIRFRRPFPALLERDGDQMKLAFCLLAYASDMGLVSTASLPHQTSSPRGALQMASLDHAVWFHRDPPLEGWLLFHKRTSSASGARGLVHGEFFAESGELVASMTQEGLMRVRRDRPDG